MATVTPRPTFNRAEADRRVRHPLQALRGFIRRYVTLEGASVALIYLSLWFWIGIALDYGIFALFHFDWIKELDRSAGENASFWMRAVLLFGLFAGLLAVVASKVLRRLMREFSDGALALVLERRFPRELGDRLITAVEMADPKLSEKYGFSQTMLDQTIRDAAERVEKLPVHEVFNWTRLRVYMIWAGVVSVGAYILVAIAGCATAATLGRSASPLEFFHNFNYVASTWFQRNILLQEHRYWLGNEYLELVRFQAGTDGEMRVARDEYRPDVYVRAIKWIVADRSPEVVEGWRALRWNDLPNLLDAEMLKKVDLPADWSGWVIDLDDLDTRVPAGLIPAEWGWQNKTAGYIRQQMDTRAVKDVLDSERGRAVGARQALERLLDWHTWTIDKIELQLKREDVRRALKEKHATAYESLDGHRGVLEALAEQADSASMRGTMRQLRIPEIVTVHRRGKKTKSSSPLKQQENYKFSFNLNELKESVEFYFSGDEYSTPGRKIVLVPPPAINRMSIDKQEPAYIYYRSPLDDANKLDDLNALRGKWQIFRNVPVSSDGAKTIIPVPLGARVTVIATVNRDLKEGTARVVPPAKRDEQGSTTPSVSVAVHGKRTFSAQFPPVRRLVEFEFEFRDTDNVKGRRHVILRPIDDQAPKMVGVKLAVTLRPDYDPETSKAPLSRAGERLLITPNALIPFKGRAEDDRGLTNIFLRYTLVALPFQRLGEGSDLAKEQPAPKAHGSPATRRASLVASTFQYVPGVQGFEWFAPTWVTTIAHLANKGSLPGEVAEPEKGVVDAEFARLRFQTPNTNDVSHADLVRLLQIQPRNRQLAAELLDLKGDKERDAFVKRLREGNQYEGLLRDVLHFVKMDEADRDTLRPLVTTEPGKVVNRVLEIVKRDAEQRKADVELLKKQPERNLIREHALDQDRRDRFDVAARLPGVKAIRVEDQKHYELHLFLSATDNNVETGPGKATPKGPFVFLIVSENELIAEIIKQERKLYNLLKETVDNLEARKTTLDAELLRLDSPQPEFSLVAARADLARKAVRETGDIARAVLDKYRLIVTELEVNRVSGPKIGKLQERVVAPLDDLTDKNRGYIPVVTKTANDFWNGLETDIAKKKKAEEAKKLDDALVKELEERRQFHKVEGERTSQQIGGAIKQLRAVLEAMQDTIEADKLIELMVRIEAEHRETERIIRARRVQLERDVLEGVFDDDKGPRQKKK